MVVVYGLYKKIPIKELEKKLKNSITEEEKEFYKKLIDLKKINKNQ